MSAYSELYIENAQKVLAQMFHCAVHHLHESCDSMFRLFVQSGAAAQFGIGNPRYTAGISGNELALEVMYRVTGRYPDVSLQEISSQETAGRSSAYWTGYTLAWYQWESGLTFKEIGRQITISAIEEMYPKYHEMDIRQSVDRIRLLSRLRTYSKKLCLKSIRESAGMSQRELAGRANMSVRSIQQYEQGRKDLSKAAYETVRRLAETLACRMEDLV